MCGKNTNEKWFRLPPAMASGGNTGFFRLKGAVETMAGLITFFALSVTLDRAAKYDAIEECLAFEWIPSDMIVSRSRLS